MELTQATVNDLLAQLGPGSNYMYLPSDLDPQDLTGLDLSAVLAIAGQETWAAAHSQYAAQPTGPSRRGDRRDHRPEAVGR